MIRLRRRSLIVALLVTLCGTLTARASDTPSFKVQQMPPLPSDVEGALAGMHGGTILLVDRTGEVWALPAGGKQWDRVGELQRARAFAAAASVADGVVLIGGSDDAGPVAEVTLLSFKDGQLQQRDLPPLPAPLARGAATAMGRTIFVVAEGEPRFFSLDLSKNSRRWESLEVWDKDVPIVSPALVALQDHVYLFAAASVPDATNADISTAKSVSHAHARVGMPAHAAHASVAMADDERELVVQYHRAIAYAYTAQKGWSPRAPPPWWPADASDAAVAYGHAHIFLFAAVDGGDLPAYHTITDSWLSMPLPIELATPMLAIPSGQQSILINRDQALALQPKPVRTNYGGWDHAVVAIYLIGMIAMGWYFAAREKNTADYFRGGRRIPWWATGMSLFATGASAISLMSMPGKAYATNWVYFSISIFSLAALPISIFFLAPLVRRLNIATANEYLERRFGVSARLFAASIYSFTQICGRMAPVMLLPSIALSAITGIDITVSILIMGLITTIYTYLGGLEAVIWTDTVQGLLMCAAVAGCLILALVKLSMGPGEIVATMNAADKLHMFDWSLDIVYPVAWVFLISTFVLTLGGIGDQNFVQRVQCTPTLRDAKKAIATQMCVAVPINVLLFSLGTALWLFYRSRPEQLNPTMETDGIFPFFVAQQLPPGLSGLVVAALLAATMSTISSSICAVSDLGVNDFYRRFARRATDRSSFLLGRALVGVIGLFGTAVAVLLGQLGAASIWDLALLVTGLISNGIIGLFWLGLLTRRAHEFGALLGVACGMLTVILLQRYTPVHMLWYQTAGAMVTIFSGYLFSLMIPARVRELYGLTIYTLPLRDGDGPILAPARAAIMRTADARG